MKSWMGNNQLVATVVLTLSLSPLCSCLVGVLDVQVAMEKKRKILSVSAFLQRRSKLHARLKMQKFCENVVEKMKEDCRKRESILVEGAKETIPGMQRREKDPKLLKLKQMRVEIKESSNDDPAVTIIEKKWKIHCHPSHQSRPLRRQQENTIPPLRPATP